MGPQERPCVNMLHQNFQKRGLKKHGLPLRYSESYCHLFASIPFVSQNVKKIPKNVFFTHRDDGTPFFLYSWPRGNGVVYIVETRRRESSYYKKSHSRDNRR